MSTIISPEDREKLYTQIYHLLGMPVRGVELTEEQIFKISKAIWNGFNRIHSKTYDPIPGAGNLYYIEEVCKKFDDAVAFSDEFKEFAVVLLKLLGGLE